MGLVHSDYFQLSLSATDCGLQVYLYGIFYLEVISWYLMIKRGFSIDSIQDLLILFSVCLISTLLTATECYMYMTTTP